LAIDDKIEENLYILEMTILDQGLEQLLKADTLFEKSSEAEDENKMAVGVKL